MTAERAQAALRSGDTLRAAGRPAEAVEAYRRALSAAPGFGPARVALGVALIESGEVEAGLEHLRRACADHPERPEPRVALGESLRALGAYAEACDAYRAALARGEHVIARTGLGAAALALGRIDEAIAELERALALEPGDRESAHRLAEAHSMAERPREAETVLRRALAAAPGEARLHDALAGALRDQGRLEEALAAHRRALELEPASAGALANLGWTLRAQGDVDGAVAAIERALELDPEDPEALTFLGKCLVARGDVARAVGCFRRALELRPNLAMACEHLARAKRFGPEDAAEIARIEAVLEDPTLIGPARAALGFALAKIHDDCGDPERAFARLAEANAIRRAARPFDPEAHAAAVGRAIELFSRERVAEKAPFGSPSELPVFVVGMLRSGTTLVEQILASHPEVHGAGELSLFHGMRIAGPSGETSGETGGEGGPFAYLEAVPHLGRDNVRALAETYLTALTRGAPDGIRRATDKMPTNFLHLGLIAIVFPRARVIHCRRDPLDVGLSIYFQHLTAHNAYAFDLYDIGRYHREYERLMGHWREILPLALYELDYERLVSEPERVSRELVAFCGLEWDPRCLAFHESRRAVLTASDWQVRQPLYRDAVGRWRRYERHLEPLRRGLAGEPRSEAPGTGAPKIEAPGTEASKITVPKVKANERRG